MTTIEEIEEIVDWDKFIPCLEVLDFIAWSSKENMLQYSYERNDGVKMRITIEEDRE